MTNDAKMVLSCLFDTIWRLFTSWHIPGTHVTAGEFIFFALFAGVTFRFLSDISGGILSGGSDLPKSTSLTGREGSVRIPFRSKRR